MRFALPLKVLLFAVVAPLVVMVAALAGIQPLGLVGYVFLTAFAGAWNFMVIRHLWKNGPKVWQTYALAGAMVPVFLCWTLLHPALFKYSRTVLVFTYFIALVLTSLASARAAKRGLGHYFVPIYNALGMCIVGIWVALDGGGEAPSLMMPLGYASGVSQALNFFYLATFMPFFFLPPMLLKFQAEDRPELSVKGKINLKTVGWGAGKLASAISAYFVGFLLIATAIGVGNISSFSDESPDYVPRQDMQFAIVARSFTAENAPVSDWPDELAHEIAAAKNLWLGYIRYDVRSEMLEDGEGLDALKNASETIHAEGLGLMLGLYGRTGWSGTPPRNFEEYREQITVDTLAVSGFADYVLPYYEPNGQAKLNLGHGESAAGWAEAIYDLTVQVRNSSDAKVLIEIATDSSSLDLIAAIQQTGVDAIGLDIYPSNWDEMEKLRECAAAVDRSLVPELWLSEFGMELSMFGDGAQANFIKMAVAEASRLDLTGCCLWALQDDTGRGPPPMAQSHFGIIRADWTPRKGYDAYAEAIAAVRGT